MGSHRIEGYFDYVVPPLEGFWEQEGVKGVDFAHKEAFRWISVIRLPEFVQKADVEWAVAEAGRKKGQDFSKVEFLTVREGLCAVRHIGPYDEEPATVAHMDRYLLENGYVNDFSSGRMRHEIYLSDVRKVAPERWKTVIRHPVKPEKEALNPLSDFVIWICDASRLALTMGRRMITMVPHSGLLLIRSPILLP